MAVNLRKKYSGNTEVSKKNRPYLYQLDFYHSGKRIMKTSKYYHLSGLVLIIILFIALISCEKKDKKPYAIGPDIYTEDTDFKIVGYLGLGGFEKINNLELKKLTHLNLAFANPDKDGKLVFTGNADIKSVVEKGHAAGLKVFISLAGGGKPDTTVWNSVLQPEKMQAFVKSILDYVEENNLDGVDVDIEGNLLPYIGNRYTPFVLELRNALHAKGKGITCALGAVGFHEAVTQESLEAYDFINVMVYDKTGPWRPDIVGPHAPFSYAEEAIKFWVEERKISSDRIVLGMPFYGWEFSDPARSKTYRNIVKENPEHAYLDQIDSLYFNGIPTIVKKTQLAKEKLNGVMFWEISQDTVHEMSLLRAVDQTLQAGGCDVTTFYKDEDGDGFGDLSKPFQACTSPDGYVSNRDDVDDTNPEINSQTSE